MYCKHCGKEIDDNSTFCKHCGKQINDTYIPKATPAKAVAPTKTIVNTKTNENRRTCLQLAIASFALLVIIIIVFSIVIHNSGMDFENITSKKPPELKRETSQTLTKIIINVYCPDNYKVVEVTLQLYDENDTVIGTHTLQGQNYKKGNTYELIYEPTMTELWYAKYIRYSISNYK